jgi:hypothetical protein
MGSIGASEFKLHSAITAASVIGMSQRENARNARKYTVQRIDARTMNDNRDFYPVRRRSVFNDDSVVP